MSQPDRDNLFARLRAQAVEVCAAAGLPESELSSEAFFDDDLLFLSVSQYGADGVLAWRSSHAGTPDSAALGHLAEVGAELVDRIAADAKLATALGDTE